MQLIEAIATALGRLASRYELAAATLDDTSPAERATAAQQARFCRDLQAEILVLGAAPAEEGGGR